MEELSAQNEESVNPHLFDLVESGRKIVFILHTEGDELQAKRRSRLLRLFYVEAVHARSRVPKERHPG